MTKPNESDTIENKEKCGWAYVIAKTDKRPIEGGRKRIGTITERYERRNDDSRRRAVIAYATRSKTYDGDEIDLNNGFKAIWKRLRKRN